MFDIRYDELLNYPNKEEFLADTVYENRTQEQADALYNPMGLRGFFEVRIRLEGTPFQKFIIQVVPNSSRYDLLLMLYAAIMGRSDDFREWPSNYYFFTDVTVCEDFIITVGIE